MKEEVVKENEELKKVEVFKIESESSSSDGNFSDDDGAKKKKVKNEKPHLINVDVENDKKEVFLSNNSDILNKG